VHSQEVVAEVEGVEPPLTEPESAVLPLDDTSMNGRSSFPLQAQVWTIRTCSKLVNKNLKKNSRRWRTARDYRPLLINLQLTYLPHRGQLQLMLGRGCLTSISKAYPQELH
jgi:hypothetical protein